MNIIKLNLMEVFATTSTIATKIDVREKAPKEMTICFRSVLLHKLKQPSLLYTL